MQSWPCFTGDLKVMGSNLGGGKETFLLPELVSIGISTSQLRHATFHPYMKWVPANKINRWHALCVLAVEVRD